MANELADLEDLLAAMFDAEGFQRVLEREDWATRLVDELRPAQSSVRSTYFHEAAKQIVRFGIQAEVISAVRKHRPARETVIAEYYTKWLHPRSEAITASPPTPLAPPAIPRRWLRQGAEPLDDFSRQIRRRLNLHDSPSDEPDTLLTADLYTLRVLILLGESGSGKTFELDELKRMEAPLGDAVSISAGWLSDPSWLRAELLKDWSPPHATARRTLYLDGLDEDRTPSQRLGDALVDALSSMRPADRAKVWIRITCRTASWPEGLESRLCKCLELNEAPKVLVLQPLSEEEALLVAAAFFSGKVAEPTTRAEAEVRRAMRLDMTALTSNPLTLRLLCGAELKDGEQIDRVKLYERGIQTLLKEPRASEAPDRRALRPRVAMSHAAWIAALVTLAGWSPIPLDVNHTALTLDELADQLGGDESELNRVLKTPLFEGAPGWIGPARRFAHERLADWLTARWILDQVDTIADGGAWLRARFTVGDGGFPPHLAGIIGWLAYMDERWMEYVLRTDPALVVTPSLPSESVEIRRQVFQGLLSAARSGALNDHYWRLATQSTSITLKDAEREVAEALDALVPDEAYTVGTWVCLVAMSTLIDLDAGRRRTDGAAAIVNALVQLTLDHEHRGYLLADRAASALKNGLTLSPDRAPLPRTNEPRWWAAHARRLRDLLIDPTTRPEVPADDEAARSARLAHVLALLFPAVISAEELVRALHQPRGYVIGHYTTFLHHELPLLAKEHPALIPPLLGWWTDQSSRDIEWDDRKEALNLWTASWSHRDDPKIWPVLVGTFYKLLIKHPTPRRFDLNQHDRRQLLEDLWALHHRQAKVKDLLATRLATHDLYASPECRLLNLDDVEWWVQLFINGSSRMREEVVTVFANRVWNDAEAHLRLLRAVNEQSLDDQRTLRDGLKLYIERAEIYERGEVPPAPPPVIDEAYEAQRRLWDQEANERRANMIAALSPSEPRYKAWWTLCGVLLHRSYYISAVPKNDFWGSISESERAQAMDRAREYLEASFDFQPDEHAVLHDKWFYSSKFGVAAILVLAEFSPSEDLGLSAQAWERWALTVVAEHVPSPILDQLGPARARVEPLPNTALQRVFVALSAATSKEAAEHLARLAQHGEPLALAAALRGALAVGLSEEVEAVMLERCASRRDPAGEVAREAARERLRAGREVDEGRWRRAGLALWTSGQLNEDDKERLIVWLDDKESLALLTSHTFWAGAPLSELSPMQLVRLYRQTYQHFPPVPQPPKPTVGEGSGVLLGPLGDRDPSGLLDSIVYTLKQQLSVEAADALEALGRELDDPQLSQRAAMIRRELQRASWRPLRVDDLLAFAAGTRHPKA